MRAERKLEENEAGNQPPTTAHPHERSSCTQEKENK